MKKTATNQRKRKQTVFFYCIMLLPVLQFCLFYVYANANMILLSFQQYTNKTDAIGYDITFSGLKHFGTALTYLKDHSFMILNSLKGFLLCTLLAMALAIFFSFYIYKKFPASGFFAVILFLPQIISSVVFVLLFKYIVTDVYIYLAKEITGQTVLGLLDNVNTREATIYFFNVYMGFGVNVLLFGGAMSGINESVVESAELDGVNYLQEFWYITMPMIFPTLRSFLIIGVSGVFTNQLALHTFFGSGAAGLATIGYRMYMDSIASGLVPKNASTLSYSELSAMGIIFSVILFALITLIKKVLDKFGPSVD